MMSCVRPTRSTDAMQIEAISLGVKGVGVTLVPGSKAYLV
jgi:hypothetical protein